jgi:TM2 domain-containing membrane protein YozV
LVQQGAVTGVLALILGALVPGAGHLYVGRRARGLVFLVAIGTLFVIGVAMQARLDVHLGLDDPLGSLLSVAQAAAGLPYFAARALGYEAGDPQAVMFEYGNTFTAVAGLLNILVMLDAFDIGIGRKR